ncbi:TetR family transcriptional regulator [Oceanispirochaeta crateris]|uniref:TetR family transcriptional regulator n=2 Tax=Oceanispirochaeta crateris TaxID=2518645 RepID=A0A5C1QTM4_9SPIO|nr:TetR family transcriptional regulator [Oceanispirochaeta crateris]
MEQKSLEKLTVKEIVSLAGVTRQTFYRNFNDKYDLVNWYFDVLAKECFEQMGISLSMREGLIHKYDFIRKEAVFFSQAFKSSDYNSIKEHDYQFILSFYTNLIEKKTKRPLDEDIQFLLEMYCHGSIAMTVEWAINGMQKTSEMMADSLIEALPIKLSELLHPVLVKNI